MAQTVQYWAPSHEAVTDVTEPFANMLRDLPFREGKVVDTPVGYVSQLTDGGCTVDAWETTYVHELTGEHPVRDWITCTALRPVIDRLSEEAWQRFHGELVPLLDAAYPTRVDGKTFFPFRRVFVVAQVN